MKAQSHLTSVSLCVMLFAGASVLGGCIMPYNYSSGPTIKESRVKKIRAGQTTKEEIRQWFGIPTDVVGPQAEATISLLELIMPGLDDSSATPRTYSELFSKHDLTEDYKIYVYKVTRTKGRMVQVGPVNSNAAHTSSETLLVLIDDKTGIVKDHIFSKVR
jgi:hypothetical protein